MIRIRKYEYILTAFWLIAINLHRFYDASGIKADIYLLYDYEDRHIIKNIFDINIFYVCDKCRNVSNILYEIGMHLSRIIPALILAFRFNHIFLFSIFAYLVLDFIAYLLFFGQGTNIYVIITVIIFYLIWKKTKGGRFF